MFKINYVFNRNDGTQMSVIENQTKNIIEKKIGALFWEGKLRIYTITVVMLAWNIWFQVKL